MRVTLESTTRIVHVETPAGTVPARVWEGTTESGIKVYAMVTRIAAHAGENLADFERELQQCAPPSPVIDQVWPARMVL